MITKVWGVKIMSSEEWCQNEDQEKEILGFI